MSYSLNYSKLPKGGFIGFRVSGLNSLRGAYIGDYIGDYYGGYEGGC